MKFKTNGAIDRLADLQNGRYREEFTRDAHAIQILDEKGDEFVCLIDLKAEKSAIEN